jgi:hypothetical protein
MLGDKSHSIPGSSFSLKRTVYSSSRKVEVVQQVGTSIPIVSVRDSQLYPPRREAIQKNEDELTLQENGCNKQRLSRANPLPGVKMRCDLASLGAPT